MTVDVQTTYNVSTANGVSDTFAYSFKILSADDIQVLLDGVIATYLTDYTLTGVGSGSGGTVVMTSVPANGTVVTRQRSVLLERSTDYQQSGDFQAATVNPDFDRLWMAVQDQSRRIDFSLSFPVSVSGWDFELPAPTAGYVFFANDAGTGFEWRALGSTTIAEPADSSVTLAKHAGLMPRYSIMARATAGTGKPEYYAIDSEKFAELANSVADGYAMTVGTGGGYSNLNAAIEAFVRRGYYPGATLYLEVLSDLTETRPVRFPVGAKVVVYSSVSRTIDLAAGSDSVDNQYQGALIIPDGAWCHFVSTSDTFTLDYSDPSGAVAAPKAAVVVHGTLTTDSSILSIAATAASLKPDHLIYSVGGRIQTTAAIILSDDATTGYSLDAYGGYIGALFTESAAANTDVIRVNYATVDLRATSGTPHYEVNGCCGKVVSGTGASGTVLTAKYSHIDLSPFSGFTTTATADCNAHLINVDGGRLNISGDFDIASAGVGCTRVVNAYNGAEVVATGCTFTGQGGDYALYGATGSTLKGSGNTYTTLTGSNLTSTWAAGGQYLNA